MNAMLFCKHSQAAFTQRGLFLKMNIEHRTSNVQHRIVNNHPIPNIQPVESLSALSSGPKCLHVLRRLFPSLFSRFDTPNENLVNSSVSASFPFNVRCWTLDVRRSFLQSLPGKNNWPLMWINPPGGKPLPYFNREDRRDPHRLFACDV